MTAFEFVTKWQRRIKNSQREEFYRDMDALIKELVARRPK